MAVKKPLTARAYVDENRRAPTRMVPTPRAYVFAGLLVESSQTSIDLGIAILHDQVVVNDGRGRRAIGTLDRPKIARPEVIAIDGIGMQPTPTKKEISTAISPSVAQLRRRPTIQVMRLLRLSLPRRVLRHSSCVAIDSHNQPFLSLFERCHQENPIPRNDRRGMSTSRQRPFPKNAFGCPFLRQTSFIGVPILWCQPGQSASPRRTKLPLSARSAQRCCKHETEPWRFFLISGCGMTASPPELNRTRSSNRFWIALL